MLRVVMTVMVRIVATTPILNIVPKLIAPEANAVPAPAPDQGKETASAVPAMIRARIAAL